MGYTINTTGVYARPWAIYGPDGRQVGAAFVSFEAALAEYRRKGYRA